MKLKADREVHGSFVRMLQDVIPVNNERPEKTALAVTAKRKTDSQALRENAALRIIMLVESGKPLEILIDQVSDELDRFKLKIMGEK